MHKAMILAATAALAMTATAVPAFAAKDKAPAKAADDAVFSGTGSAAHGFFYVKVDGTNTAKACTDKGYTVVQWAGSPHCRVAPSASTKTHAPKVMPWPRGGA